MLFLNVLPRLLLLLEFELITVKLPHVYTIMFTNVEI